MFKYVVMSKTLPRSYMSFLLFCLKESRAVSHDTVRAKRDIIKTQYRGVL
ncbi:hypothetical protein HMPREF9136_0185 [Prevotella dentalis DSM 3688]|uniref:Uncharacterized protein n=1 Tax=Prevotella dentalis (strain ATCC 49559 / DSM 3688 / JCM 13448 / NCTC 12043 / ES 2772) TaxID=908937 RepID=F9D008_PREDD|nr:hypothetical protein HMPREF9136_0185 [Prevotella dentalis DSM 3688]